MVDHCAVGVCSSRVHCKEIGRCFSAPSTTDLSDAQLKQLCEALGWQGGTFHQVLAEVKRLRAHGLATVNTTPAGWAQLLIRGIVVASKYGQAGHSELQEMARRVNAARKGEQP